MAARYLPTVFYWREVSIVDDDGVISRRHVMDPLPRYANVCKRQWVDGQEYPLVPLEARSRASHSHYFCVLHEGFNQLPEDIAVRYPSCEHMRKHLLILEGYCDQKHFVCDSPEHARDLAVYIRSVLDYALITLKGNVVQVFEAKSQSASAMGAAEFNESKRKVLDRLASMINVSRSTLEKEAGKSA